MSLQLYTTSKTQNHSNDFELVCVLKLKRHPINKPPKQKQHPMPAPRRALGSRKRKLTEEECAPIIEALSEIKKRKAAIVLELTQTALDALLKLEEIEATMDEEARKVHEDYVNSIEDYKVTFQPFYQEQAEELDEPPPTLEDARFLVQKMNQDASNTLTGEAVVVVGDDE